MARDSHTNLARHYAPAALGSHRRPNEMLSMDMIANHVLVNGRQRRSHGPGCDVNWVK